MGTPPPGLISVVHDVDRDGLGAAAMLCAQLGPENVRLHPTKSKDVRGILANLDGRVLVLDIPAPPTWEGVPPRLEIRWIDHHLAAWSSTPPANVDALVPKTNKPTTTMSMLVKHGVVTMPGVVAFVRKLCGEDPEFEWGFAFDAMARTFPNWPVENAALPVLLAPGPRGEAVPRALRPLVEDAARARTTVRRILESAPTQIHTGVVRVDLGDAEGIPLAQFSLASQRRNPGRGAVLVHRGSLLYCGRASGKPGPDLLQHFRERGLDPKGHAYVVSVRVPRGRIEDEVEAVVAAFEEISS